MSSSVAFEQVSVEVDGGRTILRDLSLRIDAGESVALIGRSGAGKTTALRLVNGLQRASRGVVRIDRDAMAEIDLIALRRRIGYIIQGVGLFPHRTVFDNAAIVPRLLRWDETRIRREAERLFRLVGLPIEEFGARFPRSLSGGEQQRVGIVRALIFEPDILLCDEPFGALDPLVRGELQETFVRIRGERGTTILFVTHDLPEALRVAGRLVLIDEGEVRVDVPASEFLRHPDPLARALVSSVTLLHESSQEEQA